MNRYVNRSKKQTGLILVVVLLTIPIMFFLSYNSISKSTFGEKITTNVVERNHAFYAAETAIAAAETRMSSGQDPFVHGFTPASFAGPNSNYKGFFAQPVTMDVALSTENVVRVAPSQTPNPNSNGFVTQLSFQPVYIIELFNYVSCTPPMTQNRAIFKVTARGWGVVNTSVVTLESFFSIKFECGGGED